MKVRLLFSFLFARNFWFSTAMSKRYGFLLGQRERGREKETEKQEVRKEKGSKER